MGSVPVARWDVVALVVTVVAFVGVCLVLIAQGAPLGHDEAVYSLRARQFAAGEPPGNYWIAQRAPGLPVVVAPMFLLGGTEPQLRVVVALFGALAIACTWLLGRQFFSPRVGVVAAVALACTPNMVRYSVVALPDVPSTALSLLALVLFWRSVATRSTVWAASTVVVALAATYTRFGAPIQLLLGLGLIALHLWPLVRPRLLAVGSLIGAVLACALTILMVPAATASSVSPWVDMRALQNRKAEPVLLAFSDFRDQAVGVIGPALGLLAIIGVGLAVVAVRRSQLAGPSVVTPLAVGVGTVVTLGLSIGHGEPRYLMPVLPFILLPAAAGWVSAIQRFPARRLVAVACLLLALPALQAVGSGAGELRRLENSVALRQAARELGDIAGDPCYVVTSYTPQVEWYSGCETTRFNTPATPEQRLAEFPPGGQVYVLIGTSGKVQPEGDALEAYRRATTDPVIEVGDPDDGRLMRHVEVLKFR